MAYIRAPFASNGDEETVPVPSQTDGSVSYVQGYPAAYSLDPNTDPAARRIERTKMNQVLFDITSAIKELQESGVAPFITAAQNGGTAFSYGVGAIVLYNGVPYQSRKAANTDLPTVAASWSRLLLSANNLSDLANVATALANLGLGEAAKRGVGTGTNQIPDMNNFMNGDGWFKLPSGHIVQFFSANVNGADVNGTNAFYPLQFPTGMIACSVLWSDNSQTSAPTFKVLGNLSTTSAVRLKSSATTGIYGLLIIAIGK